MKKRFYCMLVSAFTVALLLLSSCDFLFCDPLVSSQSDSSAVTSESLFSVADPDVSGTSSDTETEDPSSDTSSRPVSKPESSEAPSAEISSNISSDASSNLSSDATGFISDESSSHPSSEISSEASSSVSSDDTSSGGNGNDVQNIFTPITLSQYYYRSTLNSAERELYDAIVAASDAYSASIILPTPANSATVGRLLGYFFLDHPENFWWGRTYTLHNSGGRVIRLTMKMLYSETEIKQMQKEIENAAEEIFKKIPSDATDFEIEEIFHDHLVNTVTYIIPDNDPQGETMAYSLYGALIEKKGVCESYSEAFQYLCNMAGIPCFGITGKANGGGHKWNGVEIDGNWYITDVTWDDPTGGSYPKHSYFNVTAALISLSHVTDPSLLPILPDFTATKDSFYHHYGLVCDLESLDEAVKTAITFFSEDVSVGSKFAIEVMCTDADTAEDCFDALSSNSFRRMWDLVAEYNRENSTDYSFMSYYDPDMCILRFVLQIN